MKKLMGMFAVALLISGPANAEILKNLKVNGSLDLQATSARNVTDFATRQAVTGAGGDNNDRIGATLTRLLVDAKWDLLDDIHANVTLRKNDRPWGNQAGGLGQGVGGAQPLGSRNAGNTDNGILGNTWVQRANITIDKLFGSADVTLGKQYYGDAGDLVIHAGPKDGSYGLSVTSIDAFRVEWANDWLAFSGLAGTTAGGALAAGTNNTHVRGGDLLWKSLPVKVHTFLWNRLTQRGGAAAGLGTNAGKNDNLYVYGLKMRGEAMGGWLNADIAANSGEDRTTLAAACGTNGCNANSSNYTGKALLLDAGYNAELSGLGALTPWVNFGWGSGRSSNVEARNEGFTAIAPDYRPGIINRRFDGNVQGLGGAAGTLGGTTYHTNGLNNRVVWGLGLNMTPAKWEKLTAGVQLWDYSLQRVTATNALPGAATQRGAKHIGSEYGLTVDWKHSENVKLGAGVARFTPGGAIQQNFANTATAGTGNSPVSMVFGDLSVKF